LLKFSAFGVAKRRKMMIYDRSDRGNLLKGFRGRMTRLGLVAMVLTPSCFRFREADQFAGVRKY